MATTVRPAPRDEASPPAPAGGRRRWAPIAVVAAAVAVAAVVAAHLALMAPLRVPVIHPDELGYVQNAHYLARGGLKPTTEYYPGYSLLLVPLWWLSRDPLTVWRGALIVNAALAGLAVVLMWCLLGRLAPELDRRWRALIVAATAAYPALLLLSDFSMAETAFATAYLGVCLLAARAFEGAEDAGAATPGWGRWALLGAGCGLLALVHPRGFAVYVAVGLVGLVALARSLRRGRWAPLAALAAGLAVGFGVTRVLVVTLKDPASRFSAYSPGGILSRAASVHGVLSLVSEAGGQLFYLSVATLGLVPFGLWLTLRALRAAVSGDRRAAVLTRAFVGLAFVGIWAVSSLFMNLGTRADKLIYGRYNDGAVAPLLLLALAELARPAASRALGPGRARLRAVATWVVVGAGALVVSAAFTGLGHPGSEVHGPLNPVNVIAIVPYITHFGGKVEVLALLGVGLAGLAVLAAVAVRWPAVAVAALAALFVALAVRTQATYILPGSRARAAQNAVPLALAGLRAHTAADLSCVGWDEAAADDFFLYAAEFDLPSQRIEPYGPGLASRAPCGPVVASPDPGFAARYPGARLITVDPYEQLSLWVLPGTPTEATLAAAGWLLPASPGPLPAASRTDTLAFGAAARSVGGGGTQTLHVAVTHPDGGAPWPDRFTYEGLDAVRLGVWWEPSAGGPGSDPCPVPGGAIQAAACEVVDLPRVAAPGSTTDLGVVLQAWSGDGRPLPAGTYTVHLGLYQDGVGTFTDQGTTSLQVRVTR
jgi:hypothetical protein